VPGLEPRDTSAAAPELSLPDMHGQPHDLASLRGRVVLVNFWATWCPPCVYEMPGIQRLANRLAGQQFSVLAVNVGESRQQVHRFLKLIDFDATVLLDRDGETFARWGATAYPASYLIDAAGRIRFEAVGALEWDSEESAATIEALLAEQRGAPRIASMAACYGVPATNDTVCVK